MKLSLVYSVYYVWLARLTYAIQRADSIRPPDSSVY